MLLIGPGPARPEYDDGSNLRNARVLTEYDVLFIEPTVNALVGLAPRCDSQTGR